MSATTQISSAPLASTNFSFSQARGIIRDLGIPKPKRYWWDFGLSITVGHVCFFSTLFAWNRLTDQPGLLVGITAVLFPITVVTYMRSAMFIHELAHLGDRLGWFKQFWNLACGCPFLIPSFTYLPHADHHRRKSYGGKQDGEYIPFEHRSRWLIVGFLAQNFVIPFLMYARFLLMSPICWISHSARRWVHRHASTMLVDPTYERDEASPKLLRLVVRQELFCFVWLVWFTFGHYWMTGELFNPLWLLGYTVSITILMLNGVRTLGAHRWSGDGAEELTFEDQLLDTVNYPERAWVTELWGPVGTRYHSLHHLFPSLPYHDLPEAHRRLMEGLPEDSPYRDTNRLSLWTEIKDLWDRASGRKHSLPENRSQSMTTPAA